MSREPRNTLSFKKDLAEQLLMKLISINSNGKDEIALFKKTFQLLVVIV
jgi:hypothetical protein